MRFGKQGKSNGGFKGAAVAFALLPHEPPSFQPQGGISTNSSALRVIDFVFLLRASAIRASSIALGLASVARATPEAIQCYYEQ
jgi:hypothetical protein